MITKAVLYALRNDPTLQTLLARGPLGKPAVYASDPAGSPFPFVWTPASVSDVPFDTKTSEGRDIQRDIGAYDEKRNGVERVESIAERIREIFHHTSISVEAWGTVLSEVVSGPIPNDGDETVGRVLTVRLVLS